MKYLSKLFFISLLPLILLSAKGLKGANMSPICSDMDELFVQVPDTLSEEDIAAARSTSLRNSSQASL